MDVTFSTEQQALREAVRALLADRSDPRAAAASETGADLDLYARLLAMGAAELPGPIEEGIVFEECGRALAATPLVSAIGIAAPALAAAGAEDLLAATRAGTATPVLAFDLATVPEAHLATHVAFADGADLRVARTEDCTVTVLPTMDATRRLCRVEVRTSNSVGRNQRSLTGPTLFAGQAETALAMARLRGCVAVAHELVGVAQRTLDAAVAHARTREQFGRAIGSYQAVSHRCADMFVGLELARSHAYFAAWAVAAGDELAALAASQAKAAASEAAVANAEGCIQVHGGIGFTWEHDAHLALKRARSAAALLGGAGEHRRRIADLLEI